MAHTFLESWARPLLVLHAVAALALAGASTHLAIVSWRLWRGAHHLGRLARVYAQVIGGCFAAAFLFGLLMYPHYRYAVRGLYLDRYEPWASNLFDIKENLAALGLPLAVGLFSVGRKLDPSRDQPLLGWLAFLSIAIWTLIVASAVMGLVVTDVRGV
ncbi:MAG: hypothetical protein JST54_29145 [Deltaproteobacteria bacterium]|nr:hypothetical protein [Deltaproteobacteria bacterium]